MKTVKGAHLPVRSFIVISRRTCELIGRQAQAVFPRGSISKFLSLSDHLLWQNLQVLHLKASVPLSNLFINLGLGTGKKFNTGYTNSNHILSHGIKVVMAAF